MRTISAPSAAIGSSRSALTCACSTITQRHPTLRAAAASARPWLPSVALMTVKSFSAAACRPASSSGACQPWPCQRRRIRRTSAIGAPRALKLPSGERSDSSLSQSCPMPSCPARPGRARSGVGPGSSRGQPDSQRRLSRPCPMFRIWRSESS